MNYYVIGGDGQQYGPESMATLVQWAREGRLVASTVLIEEASGRRVLAGDLPGLSQNLPKVAARTYYVPTATLNYAHDLPEGMPGHRSRIVAGVLGILFGGFGVHRFYLGYIGIGLIQLILTAATCGVGHVWGFIEGVMCLTGGMRDADGRSLR